MVADSGDVSSGSSSQKRSKNGSRVGKLFQGRTKSVAGRIAISLEVPGVTAEAKLSEDFRTLFVGTGAWTLLAEATLIGVSVAGGDFALRLGPGARSTRSTEISEHGATC